MPLDFPSGPAINDTWTGSNGVTYTWTGTMWTVSGSGVGPYLPLAANNVGRNLIHNAMFNIAQRGIGPFTINGYTVDRWWSNGNTDTKSIIQGTILDGGRAAIGDESAAFYMGNAVTGNAAAGAYTAITQPIEDVRRLAGKTATVSFWAVAASGTPKLGVSIDQNFGSGGSPSAQVNGTGQSVTLSTTWTRYSLTFTIASMSGKTLGTANDHATFCNLWYSSGSTNATRSGSVGVQAATINLWGVQLEVGSVATPLEKPDPQVDLANCQRFYQVGQVVLQAYGVAAQAVSAAGYLPNRMRAQPATITLGSNFSANIGTITWAPIAGNAGVSASTTVTATGMFAISATFTASADL